MPQPPNRAGMTKDELMSYAKDFPFFNLIGLKIVDMESGWSKVSIDWRPDLTQPAGIMHGGIIASLIDTGIAHALLLSDPYQELLKSGGGSLVSVDLRVKYFRPVSSGTITCETTVPRLGRKIIHAESIVVNEEGKEVARGDSIYMTVRHEQIGKG